MALFKNKDNTLLDTSKDNEFLNKIIKTGSIKEKELIATNINLSIENFILLSKDPDFGIRLLLIGNKSVPGRILKNISTRVDF